MRSVVFDFAQNNGLKTLQLKKNKNLEAVFRDYEIVGSVPLCFRIKKQTLLKHKIRFVIPTKRNQKVWPSSSE
jgi:hypothetical protein